MLSLLYGQVWYFIFLRHLVTLMARTPEKHYFVHLDQVVKADLAWWHCFLQSWHGASFIVPQGPPSIQIHSNASDPLVVECLPSGFSCDGLSHGQTWISRPIRWYRSCWRGGSWKGRRVYFLSDNSAVVLNTAADALAWDNMPLFHCFVPQGHRLRIW